MLNISDDKPCEYMAECQGDTSLFLIWESGGLAERRAGQIFALVVYTRATQYCSSYSHLLMPFLQ